MRTEKEGSWRTGSSRPSGVLAVAVAVMAIAGLGLAGALVLESAATLVKGGAEKTVPQGPSLTLLEEQLTALLHPSTAKAKITTKYSYNWAGYVFAAKSSNDGKLTEVSAAWFAPTVTCNEPTGYVAEQVSWVGFDGWTTGTVEQGGSLAYCSNNGATPDYYIWWEFYPYNDIQVVDSISGGDAIQAYVLYNPGWCVGSECGLFTIQVSDIDNGDSFSVQGGCWVTDSSGCEGGSDANAEVISEAPGGVSYNGGYFYLADYGTTEFYEAQCTVAGHSTGIGAESKKLGSTYKVDEVGYTSGTIIQTTGGLSTDYYGQAFGIDWGGFD
jgi:hypothetical protein